MYTVPLTSFDLHQPHSPLLQREDMPQKLRRRALQRAVLRQSPGGEEIAQALSTSMERGVTIWDVTGFYAQQKKQALFFVVNRFEVVRLKEIVYAVDPMAFVSFNEVSEIIGQSGKKHQFTKL